MKKFLLTPLTIFSLVTLSLWSTSCSNSDDPGPAITAPVGKIVATIDGVSFEADGGAQISNNGIMLGGNTGTEAISVIVTKAATVGTYDVKGATIGVHTPDAEVNYTADLANLYSSVYATDGETVGTVTITEIDETNKTISGTFSSKIILDATTKELTSGSFNKIPYTTAAPGAMEAKIDGTDFTADVVIAYHGAGMIIVNGQTLNGSKIITLNFAENIALGAHTIGELGTSVYATYTASLSTFASTGGTLTVTKHDTSAKRIEGTFSFEAEPLGGGSGPAITAGSFAVSYN